MSSDSAAGSSSVGSNKSRNRRLFAAALVALAAIAVILVVGTTLSSAQSVPVFTVIDTTDAPDAQLNGVCASTYQGLCTLRAAVQEAEFAGGGRIFLSAGIGDYRLTIPAGPEANPFLSCPAQPPGPSSCPTNRTGDLDIRTNVIVNGIGAADSVIDGANINRIFDVHAGGRLWLQDMTLQNGKADFDSATFHEHGAAIHNHGRLDLDRVAVINSSSTSPSHAWGGGGITNAGEAQLANVTIARNSTDAQGGGIENRGELRTLNVTITENSAPPKRGGGIFFATAPGVKMITADAIVALNRAGQGLLGQQKIISSGANFGSDSTCKFPGHADRRKGKPYFDPNAFGPPLFYPLLPKSWAVDRHYLCQYNDIRSVLARWTATATASRAATAAPTSLSRAGRQRSSFAAREAERARVARSRSASPSGSLRAASTRSGCARRPGTGPPGQALTSSPRASSSPSDRVSATSDSPSR